MKLSSDDKSRLVKRYTQDKEAYELYPKGRFYWNLRTGEDLQTALDYFEQSIDKDRDYAFAYAGIADCYVLFSWYAVMAPKESYPKAKEAALKALQLDNQLAEAHASLASVYSNFDWDWVSDEKSYKRSIELNPSYATAHQWYAEDLSYHGYLDEGIAEFEKALTLDPLSPIINSSYGYILAVASHHERAIKQLKKTINMDQNFYMAQALLGNVYLFKGDAANSIYHLQEAFRLSKDPGILGHLAYALKLSGKTEEANRTLAQLDQLLSERTVSPYYYAQIHASLGHIEKAFDYLQLCVEQKSNYLIQLKVNLSFEELRSDPRFVELMKTVGLVK